MRERGEAHRAQLERERRPAEAVGLHAVLHALGHRPHAALERGRHCVSHEDEHGVVGQFDGHLGAAAERREEDGALTRRVDEGEEALVDVGRGGGARLQRERAGERAGGRHCHRPVATSFALDKFFLLYKYCRHRDTYIRVGAMKPYADNWKEPLPGSRSRKTSNIYAWLVARKHTF